MSRPARYPAKQQQQQQQSLDNDGTGAAAASALSKARLQFNEPLVQLHAIFPDWKEEDLISVLEETKGDIETAVARISDGQYHRPLFFFTRRLSCLQLFIGHAEQWGAVKHKKEKKPPTRERDGQTTSTHRNQGSPRGSNRGRGGARGGGSTRPHRERTTNGQSPTPASWTTTEPIPITNGNTDVTNGDTSLNPPEDVSAEPVADSLIETKPKPEDPQLPSVDKNLAQKASRKIPASSGMSWAQVAK